MRNACKWLGQLLLSLAIAVTFGYGFYGLISYARPLSQGDFRGARLSQVADQTEVWINGAAQAYEQDKLGEATKVLELTLEKLVDKGGRYDQGDRWKLERVHFLLGKCYHKLKKKDKAIESYKETLRLNPNHLPAKYNLEMIQTNQGGGGSGGQEQAKPSKVQPKL